MVVVLPPSVYALGGVEVWVLLEVSLAADSAPANPSAVRSATDRCGRRDEAIGDAFITGGVEE